jgi:hypothetical protein
LFSLVEWLLAITATKDNGAAIVFTHG